MPQRRYHETLSIYHWNQTYKVGLGYDDTGTVKEVFINCGRTGEQADTLAHDSAVLLSIALQYGIPIDAFDAISRNGNGDPTGPMGVIIDFIKEENSKKAEDEKTEEQK